MAQLSLTEVSKRFNINRTTVYRAVSTGKLSRLNNGMFDLAEVIRVFGEAPTAKTAHAPVPDKESKLYCYSGTFRNKDTYKDTMAVCYTLNRCCAWLS